MRAQLGFVNRARLLFTGLLFTGLLLTLLFVVRFPCLSVTQFLRLLGQFGLLCRFSLFSLFGRFGQLGIFERFGLFGVFCFFQDLGVFGSLGIACRLGLPVLLLLQLLLPRSQLVCGLFACLLIKGNAVIGGRRRFSGSCRRVRRWHSL